MNRISNVIPLNIAVSDASGTVDLFITDWPATHSIVRRRTRSIKVVADTLDNICERLGIEHIDWLVMDVEGAEEKVLLGANKLLTNKRIKHVVIEAHSMELLRRCLYLLSKYGYSCFYEGSYILAVY